MIDFTLSPEIEDVRKRVRDFVATHIVPLEDDPASYDDHENIREDLLEKVRAKVKDAELWAPQMPKERGGMGLPFVGQAVMYEEAGRSIFGPVCFNCAAPDDGNMRVLNQIGTDAQKEKWLQPIIDGKARGAIVMTEPHPGGGSDPTMIRTTAEPKGNDKWVVNGHKWFITGADGASHFILLAKTSDEPRRELTAFMFHKDTPGYEFVRKVPIMGPEEHGGHCELKFHDMEIPDERPAARCRARHEGRADQTGARTPHALHALARSGEALHGDRPGLYRSARGFRHQAGRPGIRAVDDGQCGQGDRSRPGC